MSNFVEKHSGRVPDAENDQWFFFPGSFDPLPWNMAEEIGIIELILEAKMKPGDTEAWHFYKYQLNHEIVYSGYRESIKRIAHIQTRSFAELCLRILQSYRAAPVLDAIVVSEQEKAAPEE